LPARDFSPHSNSRSGPIHHCAFSIVLCAFLKGRFGFALSLRLHPLARLDSNATIQTSSLNRTFQFLRMNASSFSCIQVIHISSPELTATAHCQLHRQCAKLGCLTYHWRVMINFAQLPTLGVTSSLGLGLPTFPLYGRAIRSSFFMLLNEQWTRHIFAAITKCQVEIFKSFTPKLDLSKHF
jgi:hypothetical protein